MPTTDWLKFSSDDLFWLFLFLSYSFGVEKTNTFIRSCGSLNPLNPKGFCVFERFSAYTRPMGFRDSIFKVTMESAAVLKH